MRSFLKLLYRFITSIFHFLRDISKPFHEPLVYASLCIFAGFRLFLLGVFSLVWLYLTYMENLFNKIHTLVYQGTSMRKDKMIVTKSGNLAFGYLFPPYSKKRTSRIVNAQIRFHKIIVDTPLLLVTFEQFCTNIMPEVGFLTFNQAFSLWEYYYYVFLTFHQGENIAIKHILPQGEAIIMAAAVFYGNKEVIISENERTFKILSTKICKAVISDCIRNGLVIHYKYEGPNQRESVWVINDQKMSWMRDEVIPDSGLCI